MNKNVANIVEKPHIPRMSGRQNVLVAPLNWGLGHASRCIPLIRELLRQGHRVVVAADGNAYEWIEEELQTLKDRRRLQLTRLRDVNIRYSEGNSQTLAMVRQLPGIIANAIREHRALKGLIKKYHLSLVISDNRFGLWSRKAHCVYMTHQLNIMTPRGHAWAKPLLRAMHRWVIGHYDQCWIPDYGDPKHNLSGDLSHGQSMPKHARFVGPLSRFADTEEHEETEVETEMGTYETVAIVSGPEPHRSLFEKKLRERLLKSDTPALLICGRPMEKGTEREGNLTVVPTMPTKQMRLALKNAKRIICRSGYTSLMDLAALGCLNKAELSATPGQTEQEYLLDKTVAEHLLDVFE